MTNSQNIIIEALRLLLRPISRFCLRHGLRVQDLLEAAKVALLTAAQQEIESQGGDVNVSKLAVMTGLHRRDVMRIYQREETKEGPQGTLRKIIGQWQHDKRFTNSSGLPRTLGFEGVESEFRDLVNSVSQDLNHATVLFELERIGVVKKTRDGLKLVGRTYVAKGDIKQGYGMLASDVTDLMTAVQQNVFEEHDPPNLHGKTIFDKIPSNLTQTVRELLYREGSAFHKRIRGLLSQYDVDVNPDVKSDDSFLRVALGTFSVIEDAPQSKIVDQKRKRSAG